jgi:hypothetical protein
MMKRTIVCFIVGLMMSVSFISSVQCQSVSKEIIKKFNLQDYEENVKIDSMLELSIYLFAIIWVSIFGPPMWP